MKQRQSVLISKRRSVKRRVRTRKARPRVPEPFRQYRDVHRSSDIHPEILEEVIAVARDGAPHFQHGLVLQEGEEAPAERPGRRHVGEDAQAGDGDLHERDRVARLRVARVARVVRVLRVEVEEEWSGAGDRVSGALSMYRRGARACACTTRALVRVRGGMALAAGQNGKLKAQ